MKRLAPPLLAFLAAQAIFAAVALHEGLPPFASSTWERWDSAHYLSMAAIGPTFARCAEGFCGSAGWFPGYPLAMRVVPGVALSMACHLAALCVLWLWLLEGDLSALVLAAFFPGCVYYRAVFPIAPLALCTVVFLAALQRGRTAVAAVAGFCAATLYPLGVLLAPAAVLGRRAWIPAIATCAGFAAVLAYFQVSTGVWNAYFLVHAKYGGLHEPFDFLFSRLKPLVNARYRDTKGLWTALQTLVVVAMMIAIAVRGKRERLTLAAVALLWAVPLVAGGQTGLYRTEALLLPAAALLPRRLTPWFAAAAVLLAPVMTALFLRSILV